MEHWVAASELMTGAMVARRDGFSWIVAFPPVTVEAVSSSSFEVEYEENEEEQWTR